MTTGIAVRAVLAIVIAGAAILMACGGSAATGPTSGSAPSITCSTLPDARTILISNSAVCPQTLTVPRGTQVTFINGDSRAHEMQSDPHPEHTDCPELNQVGHLDPNQRRETGNLNTARRCGFHDHLNFEIAALRGTIVVQ